MTISPELLATYRWFRQNYPRLTAVNMLRAAKKDLAKGNKRYPASSARRYALGQPFEGYGTKSMRRVEKPSAVGLRFVGYADQLTGLDHTGWFTREDDYDSLVRGVVYQLPGKGKAPRFVAGYDNPDNGSADNDGPAAIDFGWIIDGTPPEYDPKNRWWNYASSVTDDPEIRTAANHADNLAERMADEERDYNGAWELGSRHQQIAEELAELRKSLLATIRDMKGACARLRDLPDSLRNRLRASLEGDIAKRRKLLAELGKTVERFNNRYWATEELVDAFNEGAGRKVVTF